MRRRVWGLRVSVLLMMVGLVPLVGMVVVVSDELAEANERVDATRQAEIFADQVVGLAVLQSSIIDEMNWAASFGAVESAGVSLDLVEEFVGINLADEFAASIEITDAAVAALGSDEFAILLERARDLDTSHTAIGDNYERVAADLESRRAVAFEGLEQSITGMSGSAGLVERVRILSDATTASMAVTRQYGGLSTVIFGLRGGPVVESQALIAERDRYRSAMESLRVATPVGSELSAVTESIASDPQLLAFTELIDDSIAGVLVDGVDQGDIELAELMGLIDPMTKMFSSAAVSAGAHRELIDVAAGDLLVETGELRSAVEEQSRSVYLWSAGLALLTLLAGALVVRFIVRPLRRLRGAAEGLRDGRESGSLKPVGPVEVRTATVAINDAAAHFDLATRQARALALGDLNDAALDEVAPGGLGDALQSAVGTLRSALGQQEEFRRRLSHEASHDGLTRLPNRNASMAQLTRSLARTARSDSTLAVLFIDLDRFKEVNDHYGHPAGDAVLVEVAERLVTSVREGDHVGRLGGDEFVVIAEPVESVEETLELAARLIDSLERSIELPSVSATVSVGASIGVALAEDAGLSADEILRDADLAVYRAKALGRGGVVLCNEDLRREMDEQADLSVAIRGAIDNDELVLHYQPIVEPATGGIHAFEALVRWERPGSEGLVPPAQFIDFAERSNLIIDIDRWVIANVAAQLDVWADDPDRCDVPVAINVSSRHLANDHFVQHVLQPLEYRGIDPSRVIVEVTETAVVDDLAGAALKLEQLRDAGIQIAIDDFGTGYTSLAYLRSLPIDILKIDRSFAAAAVLNTEEESIVQLIIDTGHLLGITITAEGIETPDEADKLTALGSDTLQGYYYAKPQLPEHLNPPEHLEQPAASGARPAGLAR